jgi:hypothetical protein
MPHHCTTENIFLGKLPTLSRVDSSSILLNRGSPVVEHIFIQAHLSFTGGLLVLLDTYPNLKGENVTSVMVPFSFY